jgi:hypothetical protein
MYGYVRVAMSALCTFVRVTYERIDVARMG